MGIGAKRAVAATSAIAAIVGASVLGGARLGAQDAPDGDRNTVLGPGLYAFQTRIDSATCGDADRTGDVTSYYAAIDGIPFSREMRMSLMNSRFWPAWSLQINPQNVVIGDAQQAEVTGPNRGASHFEVAYQSSGRFTGRGHREYSRTVNGAQTRCRVVYEALLQRIDR